MLLRPLKSTEDINVPVSPSTGKHREIHHVNTVRHINNVTREVERIIMTFFVFLTHADGTLVTEKEHFIPRYERSLTIDKTTPVKANGDYCTKLKYAEDGLTVIGWDWDWEHPDLWGNELDYSLKVYDEEPENVIPKTKAGVYRAIAPGQLNELYTILRFPRTLHPYG